MFTQRTNINTYVNNINVFVFEIETYKKNPLSGMISFEFNVHTVQ